MSERIVYKGMVLSAGPVGEVDKRLVILTKEAGRITAFARGARKQNSALLAASNPFTFGDFEMYVGRESYTLVKAGVDEYFRELAMDPFVAAYGFYFLEIANYYTRENLDGGDMLNLLYISMKALLKDSIDNRLVRRIYEMKAMVLFGEYPLVTTDMGYNESTVYALNYIASAPINKLYNFKVLPNVLEEMESILDGFIEKHIDRRFNSLDMLDLQMEIKKV